MSFSRAHRARFVVGVVVFVFVCGAACLPGPEDVIEGKNVEILVTGVKKKDVVHLDVAGVSAEAVAREDVVSFFLELDVGDHNGSVVVERKDDLLCASFDVVIDGDEDEDRVVVGVDVDKDAVCDGRSLVDFTEVVVGDCGDPSCETATSVDASGRVVVSSNGNAVSGQARARDHDALRADALSKDADDLFRDGCQPQGGPPRETVVLTRVVADTDGDTTEESIDVSRCRGGVAARLRAHLALLREDVSGG